MGECLTFVNNGIKQKECQILLFLMDGLHGFPAKVINVKKLMSRYIMPLQDIN